MATPNDVSVPALVAHATKQLAAQQRLRDVMAQVSAELTAAKQGAAALAPVK